MIMYQILKEKSYMSSTINITFMVTPTQRNTIELRAKENGFDDIIAYIKVVALKTQPFTLTAAGFSSEEKSVKLGFEVTSSQQDKIEEKMKESECDDMESYLKYVSLHSVVTAVVEVRSTGDFEAMLQRISDSKKR